MTGNLDGRSDDADLRPPLARWKPSRHVMLFCGKSDASELTQTREHTGAKRDRTPLTIQLCALTLPCMKTWKRAQVARRLGKSVATVRRLQGVELFPTLDEDGTHHFDPAEVELLAAKMDRGLRPHSPWLRAEIAHRAEEEADERAHAARLAQQRAEADAFHGSLAERKANEERDQREHQRRALEQARAQLESVRQDLALDVARASPRDLRRLANDRRLLR